MKPVLTDRMAVIGILAGLVLWLCCLTVLWGWAYDSSGSFSLLTGLMLLGMTWLCLWRRAWLAQRATAVLRGLRLDRWAPLESALAGTLGSTKEDALRRMRLLSAASAVAVAGFILSTLCIPAARIAAALLGEMFLFSDLTWRGLEILTLAAGCLPAAIGLVCVLYATTVVRASGGRDTFAAAYRDGLWGVAVGVFAFAVTWWFGANLIYVVFGVAAMIGLAAMTAVSRGDLSTHPRRAMLPFGPPSRRSAWTIAALHAAILLVLLVQLRLLGDIFGVSLTRRMLWVFLSLVLLAFFLSRIDRKRRSVCSRQISGAALGAAAGVLVQTTEILLCRSLDAGAGVLMTFAVATQIPIAALTATLLSNQRHGFASAGGSAGAYLRSVAGGLAGGVALLMLLGRWDAGWVVMVVLAAGLIGGAGLSGARSCRRRPERWSWLGFSGVLCASLVVGLLTAMGRAESDEQIQPGLWLTSVGRATRSQRRYRQFGLLPDRPARRSDVITKCLYETWTKDGETREGGVFALRRGKWWVVGTAGDDLPDSLPSRFYAAGANPEPPPQPRRFKRWPPLSYSDPDFFRYARLNFTAQRGCDYYDGVLLAPLPADHPQAWRCYNETLLRRCKRLAEMRNPDGSVAQGIVALRTQVACDHVRRALAVARTFHQVVRSGWAVVAVRRSGLDLLLLGPNEALAAQYDAEGNELLPDVPAHLADRLEREPDVYLLPIETLWDVYSDVAPIRLANPPGERLADTPEWTGFRNYLQTQRKIRKFERLTESPSRSLPAGGRDRP